MKTAPVAIDDGYTIIDEIKSGPFVGVRVEMRPADLGEAQRFVADARPWEVKAPEFLVGKLISWNVSAKSDPEKVLPITAEVIKKQILYPLSDRWVDLVIGYIVNRTDEEDRKN